MEKTLENFKKIFKKFDDKKFYIVAGIIFLLNVFLFYMQGIQPVGDDTSNIFHSDLPMHFNKIYNWETFKYDYSTNYSLFHIVLQLFKLFDSIIPIQIPTAILLAGMNLWTLLLVRKYLSKGKKEDYIVNLMSIVITTVSMIIIPFHMPFFGIGSPNQWHNPTYTIIRPLMILSFIEFEHLFIKNKKNKPWLFILYTTICMSLKPSFLMTFIPGTLIFVLFKNKNLKENIKQCFKLFILYLPSLIIFIGQSLAVTGDSATTINFMFGGNWIQYAPFGNVIYAIIIANLFYITFLILNYKKLDKTTLCVSIILICSIIEALLFGETGARSSHLNFLSPYYTAMFISYLPAIKGVYIDKTYKSNLALNIILFLHIYSGFMYYLRFLIGLSYY